MVSRLNGSFDRRSKLNVILINFRNRVCWLLMCEQRSTRNLPPGAAHCRLDLVCDECAVATAIGAVEEVDALTISQRKFCLFKRKILDFFRLAKFRAKDLIYY